MSYTTLNLKPATRARRRIAAALCGLIASLGLLAVAPAALADTGTFTTLHTFNSTDGAQLYGGLVQDSHGNFYGTASAGGANDKGVVYKITPDGTVTVLHSFDGTDGANPEAGLVLGDDGNLYGTTSQGGAGTPASGTVFTITPSGTLTTLHSFCVTHVNGSCADGQLPTDALIKGSSGEFYGAVPGYIFKIKADGTFTTVCTGGVGGDLVQDDDGNFYGTNQKGGLNLYGSVFKCTPTGDFTVLYSFNYDDPSGSYPQAGLLLGKDGNLYGTTTVGGGPTGDGAGTIFKITPSGTLTALHVFDVPQIGGPDVVAPLVEGSDGNFYGVAVNGGENTAGSLFEITPAGTFTLLHSFNLVAGEGINPRGALLETRPGVFVGATFGGGAGGLLPGAATGTVYRYSTSSVTAPLAPASLQAVSDAGAVDLTWAASNGATSYNVYQGTAAGGEAATPVKTGITDTKVTISGLTNGTAYYFTVAAVNSAGAGAHSNEASATPLAAPRQVTGLTATAGDASIKLTWTATAGASGYTIARGTAAGAETPVATGVSATTYSVTGLTNGTAYYFTVTATNSAGGGTASAEVNATPAAASSGGGTSTPPPTTPPAKTSSGGGGPLSPMLLLPLGLLIWVRRSSRRTCTR